MIAAIFGYVLVYGNGYNLGINSLQLVLLFDGSGGSGSSGGGGGGGVVIAVHCGFLFFFCWSVC